MTKRFSIGLAALLAVMLVPLSTATAQQSSALAREVEFIRRLATRLRFIELAQSQVQALQKSNRDSADFKLVSQLGLEITLIGARAHPNREDRRRLFKDTLEKAVEFIDRYGSDPVGDDARVTMVQACVLYGEFLQEEIAVAREEAPDTVAELEESAAEVFRKGVDVCDKFLKNNEGNISHDNPSLMQKYYYCWLNKGILQRENARAVKRDREALAGLARETFEELILEIGEESLLGLRGWFEMSKIGSVMEDYKQAVSEYQDTIDGIASALNEKDELGLAQSTCDQLFELMQDAYNEAAAALLKDGKPEAVITLGEAFRAHLQAFGVEGADPFEQATPTSGHQVFLVEAVALAETGESEKVSQALMQIQKIVDAHPGGDFVGIQARARLKDVMSLAGGDLVNGETLFEIAKGEYQSRNYDLAVEGFKRAYAAMDPDEKKRLGLDLWTLVGRSYGLQKRYMESTLAFTKALELHANDEGSVEAVAENLERAWSGFRAKSRSANDAPITRLGDKVNALLIEHAPDSSVSKRIWKDASNALRKRQFDEAARLYSQVAVDSPYYEPAQSSQVNALQAAEKYAEARQVMQAYEQWLTTPAANIPPGDKTGMQQRRDQTKAVMAYFDAAIAYDEATKEGAEDPEAYPAVVAKISTYLDTHRKFDADHAPRAFDMLARLYCDMGDVAKGEQAYRTLAQEFPGHQYVSALATRIFDAHYSAVKALETEYEAAANAGQTGPKLRQILDKLNAARRSALAIGQDYIVNAAQPQYGMLSVSMYLARDLKDWSTTERIGRKMVELFGDDKTYSKRIEEIVEPAIGEALLRKQDFRAAEVMLRAAVEKNPKNYPIKRLLALTLGGWIDMDESLNQVPVAGLGKPDEAYLLMFKEYRNYVRAKFEDYSLEWYRFTWECYLFAKRAAAIDSKYTAYAQALYRNAEAREEFATLRGLGPEGNRLYQLFLKNR